MGRIKAKTVMQEKQSINEDSNIRSTRSLRERPATKVKVETVNEDVSENKKKQKIKRIPDENVNVNGQPAKSLKGKAAKKLKIEAETGNSAKDIKPRQKRAFSQEVKGNGTENSKEKTNKKVKTDPEITSKESATDKEVKIGGKKSSKKEKSKKEIKQEEPQRSATERTLIKKEAAAVDGLCPVANSSHVFCEGDEIWDCMLNQTNIQFNNNKYYIIQLLKDDNKDSYYVWMRWGRVGCNGQNCLKPCQGNLHSAKETFKKKFADKTRNSWETRETFQKVPGKYDLLQMDYSDGKDEVDFVKKEQEEKPIKKVESLLEIKVKALIELICDVKAMEAAVVEMKYDANKAPLGKLTSEQVKAGYKALKEIEDIILSKSGKVSNKDLLEACNAFYTRIPHYFGMKVPPLIRTTAEIQEKMQLLQALGDIQAAMNIINQPMDENLHPVDQQYRGLECDIEALKHEDEEYQLLEKYLKTTHGKTHSMYKISVVDIFKVNKSCEASRFKDVGNRMLLWHGSRLTNWAGILSQGLKIAPPEAPSTGYMFGKGIYFADMASKSANYCMPSHQNDTGILVLCDVSLGKCNELYNADYDAHKLPAGYHSVRGIGRTCLDHKNFVTMPNSLVVPMGPSSDVKNDSKCYLQYNEYIVYNVAQVKIKYLLKVQFNFK